MFSTLRLENPGEIKNKTSDICNVNGEKLEISFIWVNFITTSLSSLTGNHG